MHSSQHVGDLRRYFPQLAVVAARATSDLLPLKGRRMRQTPAGKLRKRQGCHKTPVAQGLRAEFHQHAKIVCGVRHLINQTIRMDA